MRTFIGPDIILSDLTEGPTLFAQSACYTVSNVINSLNFNLDCSNPMDYSLYLVGCFATYPLLLLVLIGDLTGVLLMSDLSLLS